MSPLLAPLLAQVVSLQLGDRTEGRYVDFNGGKRYEASTSPQVGVSVTVRRTGAQLSYAPGITISPIDSSPRRLYVFHQVGASVSHALRLTTFSLSSSLGVGSLNLKLVGLQGLQPVTGIGAPTTGVPTTGTPTTAPPATGTPTTGTPTTGAPTTGGTPTTPGGAVVQVPQQDQRVRFYTSTTTFNVAHRVTKNFQLTGIAGSSTASGRDEASRAFYPTLQGWTLGGSAGYTFPLSKADSFTGLASLLKTWSSNDNEAATLNGSVTWNHNFSPRTSGLVGAGINITRFSQSTGLAGFSVFPTASVGAAHQVPVGRGGLAFSVAAFSSPALDPLRALVDPRVGVTGSVGYTHKKFFATTSGSVALSVAAADSNSGAVNAASADARTGYFVGKLTAVDAGARVSRQTYGGVTVIPTSYAAYVGLTIGYAAILFRGH